MELEMTIESLPNQSVSVTDDDGTDHTMDLMLQQHSDMEDEDTSETVTVPIADSSTTDVINATTEGVDETLNPDLDIASQPSTSDVSAMSEIGGINNISGVDIVTLQPNQLQSMFQIVGSSGDTGSYILSSDGQLVQATASGENQGFQTVTLPSAMAALIQGDCRDTENMEGQAVQLEDGTTAVVQGLKENTLASKILEGQVIQLEDGTTGLLQAGFPGTGGVQSVTLEDGSTAYISLFGDATTTGPLTIDSNQATQQVQQAIGVGQVSIGGSQLATSPDKVANIKLEPANAEPQAVSQSQLISMINNTQTSRKQSPKVVYTPSEIDPIVGLGEKTSLPGAITQPHVSGRALAMGDKAYKCMFESCGRLYTTHHHLKVHERSHTGDKPFRCEFASCGKAFPTGYGLKSHTRVHTGEKPYRCSDRDCTKAFKTSGDLQKHRRTHTGERPFPCPFEGCDRSFTTSNIRKVHIRTHTGERPYICDEEGCGKTFASATNYKNHIRIHTGEKPYVCTVEGCGKRFTEYSSLYKHHVVHTQSKPYICNHCHKTYRQTSTLAMHKRTVHNDHDLSLEPDGTLLETVGGVQILTGAPVEVEKDGESGEGDGTLVINTSDASFTGGRQDGTNRMLSALQAVPQGSPALLQHLQPSNLGVEGVQQVFLITDPAQLQTIKNLTSQVSTSTSPQAVNITSTLQTKDLDPSESGDSDEKKTANVQLLDGTSNVITVIAPTIEPEAIKDAYS